MFRFFRSIRQSLLAENKTLKHLKYAVGEVLLVVIGILIALSVNNWNEGRKLELVRLELIENLRSDFQLNLVSLDEGAVAIKKKSDGLSLFLQESVRERPELSVNELKKLASNGFGAGYRFQPALGSYRSAISTGSIGLIRDPALNELFLTFEAAHMRFQDLAKPTRTDAIYGNYFELAKLLGSINVFSATEASHPKRFSLSDEQYREFISRKEVYAIVEARQSIALRMFRILRSQQETTQKILAALEALD